MSEYQPHVAPEDVAAIVRRLSRAQGQIGGIVRMLEDGRSCEDVVTQMTAVGRALDRAGFAVIASTLRQCLEDPDRADIDIDRLERLFLSLA